MKRKFTLDDMKLLAKKHGGECLSKEYKNKKTKLTWKCGKGHIWEAAPNSLLYTDTWCPVCGREKSIEGRRLGIEKVRDIGKKRGFILITKLYINSEQKLDWQCINGHIFKANITTIKNGKYPCPDCRKEQRTAHNKKKIDYFYKYVKNRNGKLVKVISDNEFLFECDQGHQWIGTRTSVISGSWCVKCSYKKRGIEKRNKIDEYQLIAKERGGKLLSTEYKRISDKLKWECKQGHVWEASAGSVKAGSWCPQCSSGLGERICRLYFNKIFSEKFIRAYPEWFRNERGNLMELDGYSKKLSIAFEHQGEQHYSLKTRYINDKENLKKRIMDDELKAELCNKHNVALFIIPSINHIIQISEMIGVIKDEAKRLNIQLPSNIDDIEVDINSAYKVDFHREKYMELKEIAHKKGGEIISEIYESDRKKLKFKCKEGHIWETIPKDVFRGHWCRKCAAKERAEKQRITISEINDLVKNKGRCLSEEYLGYDEPLLFICNEGHKFKLTPKAIKRRTWCPECMKIDKSKLSKPKFKEYNEIAKARGGKLLSKDYINDKKDLLWECSKGHTWQANGYNIKNSKTWCPICAKNQPFTIEYIKEYISKYEGECLSTEYKNYRTVLKFRCKNGHVFENSFINIKRGVWCPKCKENNT